MNRSIPRCSDIVVNRPYNFGLQGLQRIRHTSTRNIRNGDAQQHQHNLDRKGIPRHGGQAVNWHGLFNWKRWDGSLWATEETLFYKLTAISQQINRLELRLSEAKEKLHHSDHRYSLDRYWVARYSDLLNSSRALEPFARIAADISILKLLISTAPVLARDEVRKTYERMDIDCFAIQEHISALAGIWRIKAAANHHTPLFEAHVHRKRCMSHVQEARLDLRLRLKLERQRLKAESGHKLIYNLVQPGRAVPPELSELREGFDARPSSWVVEGLYSQMLLLLARARARRFECTTYGRLQSYGQLRMKKAHIMSHFNDRLFHLTSELGATTQSLYDLNEDLAALRYYRINKFPSRDMTWEINVGRKLYMAINDRSDSSPMSLAKNSKRKNNRLRSSVAAGQVNSSEERNPHVTKPLAFSASPLIKTPSTRRPPPSPRSKKYVSPTNLATLPQTKQNHSRSQLNPLVGAKSRIRNGQRHDGTLKLFDLSKDAVSAVGKVVVAVGNERRRTLQEQWNGRIGKSA